MIKLVRPDIETHIVFEEGIVNILCCENPTYFYSACFELFSAFNGGGGSFVFSDREVLNAENIGEMLPSLFHIDFSSKKLQNLMIKQFQDAVLNTDMQKDYYAISSALAKFYGDLFQYSEIDVEYNDEIDVTGLIKLSGFKIKENYNTLLEKIVSYINAVYAIKKIRIICFVNLKVFLSVPDLELLYKHCNYLKINILLLESKIVEPLLKNEKAIIIDKDLCEILVNY